MAKWWYESSKAKSKEGDTVTTTIITTIYYIEYLLLAWHFVQSFSNTNTSDARNTSPRQVLLFIDRLGEVKLSAQGHPVLAGDKGRNWIRVCPLAMSGLDYFTRRSPFYLLTMPRLGVPKIDSTKELRKKAQYKFIENNKLKSKSPALVASKSGCLSIKFTNPGCHEERMIYV